jgi:hypothetical protein
MAPVLPSAAVSPGGRLDSAGGAGAIWVEPARLLMPWEKLLEYLPQVRAITVRLDNQRYLMRTELKGHSSEVFRAVGVPPPPLAQPVNG